MADLITSARAKQAMLFQSSFSATEDAVVAALVTACSKAVESHCRRTFAAADYDERYEGRGFDRLVLRRTPVVSVARVRGNLTDVLTVCNTDAATNQRARAEVTATGLSLTRVAAGTASTATLAFGTYATLGALAAAVNALGNGWSAAVAAGFENYASADLEAPAGGVVATAAVPASLTLFADDLGDYTLDAARGWLTRDPAAWEDGTPYRVAYRAGYATVPEDVQEACAQWVAGFFKQSNRDPGVVQATDGTAGDTIIALINRQPTPLIVTGLLAPYRRHSWGGT